MAKMEIEACNSQLLPDYGVAGLAWVDVIKVG